MKTALFYSPYALKQLGKLDATIAKRLTWELIKKASTANPLTTAEPLQGNLSDRYRYRIGDYRVIFIINKQREITILTILDIDHRKDIYR